MYQIPTSNQVSFRVSDYEKSVINEYLTSLEKDHNVEASNFRDVLLKIVEIHKAQEDELKALTDEVSSLSQALAAEKENKPAPETIEVEKSIEVLPNDLSEKFAEIRQVEFEGEEISELEILESILEANHSANEANKLLTLQIEKLNSKAPDPVEPKIAPLQENQILVELHPRQKEVLQFIAGWRFEHNKDATQLSLAGVLKGLAFQPAPLTNYLGEFATGVTTKDLRKKDKRQSDRTPNLKSLLTLKIHKHGNKENKKAKHP